jgi:hypothetical protein
MAEDVRFKIPESGLAGLKALISLGPEGVTALCELAKDLPLTLNMRGLTNRLSNELKVETRAVSQFVMGALMPLNHLRVYLKLETPDFLKALSDNLEKEAPEKWRSENLAGWKAIEGRVAPLFEKDNFFSVSNKSFQLLVNRPNPVQDVRILSELRPVYSEDATSVKAFVLSKTRRGLSGRGYEENDSFVHGYGRPSFPGIRGRPRQVEARDGLRRIIRLGRGPTNIRSSGVM